MSGKTYLAWSRVLFFIFLAMFVANTGKSMIITAVAFFYLGFALRPDINIAWRQFNRKLDEWASE